MGIVDFTNYDDMKYAVRIREDIAGHTLCTNIHLLQVWDYRPKVSVRL